VLCAVICDVFRKKSQIHSVIGFRNWALLLAPAPIIIKR